MAGSHPKLQVYSMKSKRRGVFFFVNIIRFKSEKLDRHGAEMDRDNLVTLFKQMNYTVFYYEDITKKEFLVLLKELIASEYIGDLHNNETVMEFADGQTLFTDQVVIDFSHNTCPSLTSKPKVFFFPFCWGKISDKLKEITMIQTDMIPPAEVPTSSDILICYGTVPGFSTHRDTGFGRYIQEMCKIFAESHIDDMLKMVGAKTQEIKDAGRVKLSATESRGFNRLMFFNPKIFD